MDNKKIIEALKKGKVGVLPTDTIYGLHGSIFNKKAVEKIYKLKGKPKEKSFIILISSIKDLEIFGINVSEKIKTFLERNWPNPLSIIFEVSDNRFNYLKGSNNSLAFRIPNYPILLEILKNSGPLVSTSANKTGQKSSENIKEAKKYFEDKIDFYLDAGELISPPSTLIKIAGEKIEVLREGAIKKDQLTF